jgi:hypothetical protein
MSDEAAPSSADAPVKLELEPYVPPPAFATETIAAPAPPAPPTSAPTSASAPTPTAAPERNTATGAERRRIGTSVFASLTIHLGLFVLLLILLPGRTTPPEDPVVITVNLKDWHWVGDAPESEGTGPRGPAPETPVAELPKGKEVAPGFLDDDKSVQGSIGVGGAPAGSAFAGRLDGKDGLVAAGGGDGATEGAVHMALEWLARHQEADGSWNAKRFDKRCQGDRCGGTADEPYVAATTALSLLPFLGAGHTYRDGPWKDAVRRGLVALNDRQRADGGFDTGPKRVYGDAFATLAVSEAYGLTKDERLGDMARKAVARFVKTQNEEGGWRYEPSERDGDSSVTGWVAMSLVAAKKAGVDVPEKTLARCRSWFAGHTGADGVVGYVAAGTGSRSLLGVGYFVPLMLGTSPDDPRLCATAAQLEASPPRWPVDADDPGTGFGMADPLHWYYGALAAFQRGGGTWKVWNDKLRPLLLTHQEKRGCLAGSWAPVGQTGAKGGRIVTTALCALSLEVYYRYPRVISSR